MGVNRIGTVPTVTIAMAVASIAKLLDAFTEEERRDILEQLLENRCRKCLDYSPNGNFWCCYDSRGD